jgi:transcription initiation factor TFIIH subunit 4
MLGQDLRGSVESLQSIVRPLINRRMIGAMMKSKDKHMWPVGDAFKTGLRNALTGMYVSTSCHFIGESGVRPSGVELCSTAG